MKIMVMGHGAVGSVLCEMFSRERKIKSIVCVEKTITHFRNKGKIHFKEIDISDIKQITALLKKEKPDLIINASLPFFNKILLGACLKNRVNYMDLASYWDFDKNPRSKSPYKVEQLDFNEKFKKKKLIGLINTGASPGLTNLLAKECVDLFDKIDSIKIRLYENTKTSDFYFPWSIEWLLDEINWRPLVYRKGKFKVMENFSEEEVYMFPRGIGKKKVYLVSQEEVGTIPLFIKVKNVDIKIFDNQANIAKFLMRLGLVSEEEIKTGKCEISPAEFISALAKTKQKDFAKMKVPNDAQFIFAVEAEGNRNGRNKRAGFYAIFPEQKEINRLGLYANFISYPTALAVKVFAMIIPKIKNYGVFPPEAIERDMRHEIINELKKHVKIREFVRKR
ncbi:MAG TPA: saccharopine dehydrogenase C-terminal domain-containing protein [Candidatus Nanoarchaeia archaeon]|nr:saccharopine dehydrogenase C-terminal domain-containing protein [Candidatus Nanoarchaeia archaeon]